MEKQRIEALPLEERAKEKGLILGRIKTIEKTHIEKYGIFLSILDTKPLEKGVECFVQAWDERGNQLGFGEGGTIDIERIRIFNPPILAEDGTTSLQLFFNQATNQEEIREFPNYVEDPRLALLQSLSHTISVIKKPGNNIQKGKVGNTTSTFYPDSGTGSTTCDGEVAQTGLNTTFATLRGSAGNGSAPSLAQIIVGGLDATSTSNQYSNLWRSIYTLDTSSIPDTDVISAAVFSCWDANIFQENFSPATQYVTVGSTPASNNTLVNADYAQLGSTAYSNTISFVVSQYNDMTFNGTGIAAIDKTGITKLGTRGSYDQTNVAPTWGSGFRSYRYIQAADTVGTTNDPKLVVTHAAPSAAPSRLALLGVG